MRRKHLRFGKGFRVVLANNLAQFATMVIPVGGSEGGPENNHEVSDQWLFVVEGEGLAIINKKRVPLRTGELVLIEAGECHEIRNTGQTPLATLNCYVPCAYDSQGNEIS
jgi:mannose-6-phosphate isomerase-like protein (cupin superfamily)